MKTELTKEQAIDIYNSEVWKDWTFEEKVKFQLFEDRLCMPFNVFHEAIEKVFDRPVYTHEFAFRDLLEKEYLGERDKPTLDEILELIPSDKRVLITTL